MCNDSSNRFTDTVDGGFARVVCRQLIDSSRLEQLEHNNSVKLT